MTINAWYDTDYMDNAVFKDPSCPRKGFGPDFRGVSVEDFREFEEITFISENDLSHPRIFVRIQARVSNDGERTRLVVIKIVSARLELPGENER